MSWVAAAFVVVVVGIVVWAVLAQRRRDRAPLRRPRPASGAAPRSVPVGAPGSAGRRAADVTVPHRSGSSALSRAEVPAAEPASPEPAPAETTEQASEQAAPARPTPSPRPRSSTGSSALRASPGRDRPGPSPEPGTDRPPAHRRVGTLSLVASPFTPSTPGNLRTSTAYSASRFLGSHYVVAGPRRVKVPFDLLVHEMELDPGELAAVERFVRCRVVVVGNPASGSVHVQEEIPVATVDVSALRQEPALARALEGTRGEDDEEGSARAAYDVALTLAARRFPVTELIDLGEAPTARILLPPIPAPREAPGHEAPGHPDREAEQA